MKPSPTSARQRGATALFMSIAMMIGISLVMLYLNRSLIFEQKTSVNQLRSTTAQEVAQAGLEWAVGMLNTPFDIDNSCNALTTAKRPFRKKYMLAYWGAATPPPVALYASTMAAVPVQKTYPGCQINGTTLSCNCPDVTIAGGGAFTVTDDGSDAGSTNEQVKPASFGNTSVLPNFTVSFAPVHAVYPPVAYTRQNDNFSVLVTVTGCTPTSQVCTPGTSSGVLGPDGVATVSAVVRLQPQLRGRPPAGLTCGGSCNPGGSFNIVNTDPGTNGITINAGGSITVSGGASTATIPGLPPQNAQISNDPSLSNLAASDPNCSNSSIFKAYFGTTISSYATQPQVDSITCSSANDCGTQVVNAYNQGWRSFYFPAGLTLNNSSGLPGGALGTESDPVTLVVPGQFKLNGNISVYGMVFSNDAVVNEFGTGTSNIYGAAVVCNNQSSNGNGTLAYDSTALQGAQIDTATAVRVPGSWTDACSLSTSNPPVRTCH
ncbi:hypothetical protein [Roseateles saccharophilus]|uniref:Type 4 fimbrial biogenesis protein PilX N-terminal domain-containing protein n=1 Tax=Roseateles saccharophilus TaxID=304 RepID=A0A4R3UXI8_ROSSA|nr:hypothetical protein [Roseateles saccharophilus]MDG0832688.1 hypothetical protein [Roseateles saccharophilus]TCU95378.1 hypothetical protein EV671_101570 [Roseateles saccharophilus]